MKMQYTHNMSLVGLLICLITQSISGQESLLDLTVYGSDKDSIVLRDYVEGNYDHLILFQPEACQQCADYYVQYRQMSERWKEEYNLHVTVIAPPISNQASIESQILSYALDTGLDILLSDPSLSLSMRSLLVNAKLTETVSIPNYMTIEELESAIQSLSEAAESQFILDRHLIQCQEDLTACNDSTQLLYTSGELMINGHTYTEVQAYGSTYALRESLDGRQVYLYDRMEDHEYLLLEYTGRQCDSLELYSVLTGKMQTHQISEYTCVNGVESWVLELPFDCDQQSSTLTLTYGQGTNAGLIPLYDDERVYTKLLCQYVDALLTHGDVENCPIAKPDQLSHLLIYPNPTQGKLFIDPGIRPVVLRGLYSVDGKLLLTLDDSPLEIDLGFLPAGIYFLATEQDFRTTYHKIVKY